MKLTVEEKKQPERSAARSPGLSLVMEATAGSIFNFLVHKIAVVPA